MAVAVEAAQVAVTGHTAARAAAAAAATVQALLVKRVTAVLAEAVVGQHVFQHHQRVLVGTVAMVGVGVLLLEVQLIQVAQAARQSFSSTHKEPP